MEETRTIQSTGGIRGKLRSMRVIMTVWNVVVLALVLIALGFALRYAMQQRIGRDIDRGMADFAHGTQHFVATSTDPNDRPRWVRRRMRDSSNPDNPNGPGPGPGTPPPNPTGQAQAPGARPAGTPRPRTPDAGGFPNPNPNGPTFYEPAALDLNGQPLWPEAATAGAIAPKAWDPTTFAKSRQGKEVYSTILIHKSPVRIFSVPLKRNDQIIGVLQVTSDLSVIPEALGWLNHTLLTFIPWVLVIVGVLGGLLTTLMIRPVRRLADAAEQIEGSNMHGRLPVTGSDEFAELAVTFNNMLERLESAFRQLEESSEQQRRFTGDASHELRTPLTIIKANASLALSGDRSADQYRQAMTAINQAADRMNRLVQDLLLLARSDSGQMVEVPLKTVVIKDAIEEAVEALAHSDKRTALIDVPDQDLAVRGDYEMLVRLVTNLLSNAARHTPAEGAITARAVRQGDKVVLSVADTGEGIAPEHLAHLTERFYRVDAARSSAHGGTGLGLAIVQTIVGLHHGEMAIESTLGKGTKVAVTLQAAQVVAEPPVEKKSPTIKGTPALPAARA